MILDTSLCHEEVTFNAAAKTLMKVMDKTTEIRKLPPADVFKLGQILDNGSAWKQVMAIIPVDPNNIDSVAKYSVESIRLIEVAGEKQNRSCTEILLDEWGTSGRIRPNLNTLLQVLIKAQLYRAAEYVAVEVLKDEAPMRPSKGPAAAVDLTLPPKSTNFKQSLPDPDVADIPHVPFKVLKEITNNFDDRLLRKEINRDGQCYFTGHRLGTGAFGTVYYGEMDNGRKVAVKKLAEDIETLTLQFENEIKTLSQFQHENLVPLLGFSCDAPSYCLVYEFMANGSLLDRLQIKEIGSETNEFLSGRNSSIVGNLMEKALTWQQRLNIAIDSCNGIHFLHTSNRTPLIHRDIKTANILLDERLTAKLGDFGLVKSNPNTSKSKILTSNVFGTSAYMAPEAFRGDVSVKMDVFSFGVVLLELLTGLPPYDENREGADLVTFIEETVESSIEFLLDENAGNWDVSLAQEMFHVSQRCLEEKKKRPFVGEVLQKLQNLKENVSVI